MKPPGGPTDSPHDFRLGSKPILYTTFGSQARGLHDHVQSREPDGKR